MGATKYPKIAGYELVRQIGGGGFSTVFEAVNRTEKEIAACKVIMFDGQTTDAARKAIEKEMKIHSALHHQYVLRFINAIVVEMKHREKYIPGIYMLMELAGGGDLFDKIVPDIGVGDEVAQFYFEQLVEGMEYIHSQGVCHRDLKPENLLLDGAGTLKISDFGLSSVFKLRETGKTRLLSERCGSLPYVAPELNGDTPYQAEPIDLWGIGVILYTLVAGNTPWDEPTINSPEFRRYVSGEIFSERPWCRFGPDVLQLLRGLLNVDPAQRWTMAEISQHAWYTRPSQLQGRGTTALAERLTEALHRNGDIEIAAPDLNDTGDDMDIDGDQMMLTASRQTQFTQTLMLFVSLASTSLDHTNDSAVPTQSGVRYTPHLTRFYASLTPSALLSVVEQSLNRLNVQTKIRPSNTNAGGEDAQVPWLRVGGYDRRKTMFKGWVVIENFSYRGSEGSFCVMQRDEGNPISWRQLWKALIESEGVDPYVLRKRK